MHSAKKDSGRQNGVCSKLRWTIVIYIRFCISPSSVDDLDAPARPTLHTMRWMQLQAFPNLRIRAGGASFQQGELRKEANVFFSRGMYKDTRLWIVQRIYFEHEAGHATHTQNTSREPCEDWRFLLEALHRDIVEIFAVDAACKRPRTSINNHKKCDAVWTAAHFAHPCEKSVFQIGRTGTDDKKPLFDLMQ